MGPELSANLSYLNAQTKRFVKMLNLLSLHVEEIEGGEDAQDSSRASAELHEEIKNLAEESERSNQEAGSGSSLSKFLKKMNLSPLDRDVYLLRLALSEIAEFELICATVIGKNYPDRTRRIFVENLVQAHHGDEAAPSFELDAPLFSLGLLEYADGDAELPALHRRIVLNDIAADLLLRRKNTRQYLKVRETGFSTPEPYLDGAVIQPFASSLAANLEDNVPAIHQFHGPAGSGKRRFARYLSSRANLPLLEFSLTNLGNKSNSAAALSRTIAAAHMHGHALLIEEADLVREDENSKLLAVLDHELLRPGLVAFIVSEKQIPFANEITGLRTLELKAPDLAVRRRIWSEIIQDYRAASDVSANALATVFRLTGDPIRKALREAAGLAGRDGIIDRRTLFQLCRGESISRMSELAHLVEPKFGWDDLVLNGRTMNLLKEIHAGMFADIRVFDEWHMDRVSTAAKGHSILFTGEPGTGKSMAASIMASEMGLELYKVDLSRVSSKYVGEIEKNLSTLFDEAEKSNAALFFDEADALFSKRGEIKGAQDQYNNQQIGFLLQKLEGFQGVVFLATNLEGNIDKAFERRFDYNVRFPYPEENERMRIWERAFALETPLGDDVDFRLLAREFETTGAQIKSIALKAARIAAADHERNPSTVNRFDIVFATVRDFDKIRSGWELDYDGPLREDINRVRNILQTA